MMELAKNGMDVARFNFSHGEGGSNGPLTWNVKGGPQGTGISLLRRSWIKRPQNPYRKLKDGRKVTLKEGQTYTLTTRQLIGDENIGYINYSGLGEDVVPGNKILIDDGLIEMDVMEVNGTDIVCKVINGGELGEKRRQCTQ